MDKILRRVHPPAFKAKVTLEAIKEQKTISELVSIYGVHPTQITKWKRKLLDGLELLFSDKFRTRDQEQEELIEGLYKQIGKLKVEADWLKKRLLVNHKRIHRLMREMGLEMIYPKPNLSKNIQAHPVYPYLLKGMLINRPNLVWGTDITYIRLKQGFVYLVAFMDWFSRFILSWRLSISLGVEFCVKAAKEAFEGFPRLRIRIRVFNLRVMNTCWNLEKTRISMDGRGRCMDNIFNERFWRSLKYEDVYLKNYETVPEAKQGIDAYIDFYNYRRLHESHNYKTPAEIYFEGR